MDECPFREPIDVVCWYNSILFSFIFKIRLDVVLHFNRVDELASLHSKSFLESVFHFAEHYCVAPVFHLQWQVLCMGGCACAALGLSVQNTREHSTECSFMRDSLMRQSS